MEQQELLTCSIKKLQRLDIPIRYKDGLLKTARLLGKVACARRYDFIFFPLVNCFCLPNELRDLIVFFFLQAYVQQLETSRLKLIQLEQELDRARQQGFYVGNGIDTNSLGFSETMNPGFESRTMSLLEKI
jgi:hypothetical protein